LIAANYLRHKISQRLGHRVQMTKHAMQMLGNYDWPGNVRELGNIIERAVILCEGSVLQEEHLTLVGEASDRVDRFPTLEQAEKSHILRALQRTDWVLAGPQGAAALLGMNRSTLWSRMRKLGIEACKAQTAGRESR
jgi:formate hydrogenlyase transcriptional activator